MPARLHASCTVRLPGVSGRNDGFRGAHITLSSECNRCALPDPIGLWSNVAPQGAMPPC
jgi:hypothetical protein